MKKWIARVGAIAAGACCALGLLAPAAEAASVHWKSAIVDYAAEGKDIKDVLRDFGASEGIATRIEPDVTGSVSGKFRLPPRRFIDTLASSFGFVWYYDGEVLDIVPASDLQSTLVKLDTAGTAALRDALDRLHIADDRFPIVYDESQGTALVSGPPRYVQLVNEIASRLDMNAARLGGTQVRVFPLSHAWAEDRDLQIDGQQVTLQGVVSVLNGIYHPELAKAASRQGARRSNGGVTRNTPIGDVNGNTYNGAYIPQPIPSGSTDNKGILAGLTGQPSPAVAAIVDDQQQQQQQSANASAMPTPDASLPVIVADQRTNSVVIRDTGDRMAQYDKLIDRLDVKPQLIEIEAHIIEIDDTALQQLGVDWTAKSSHFNVQTNTASLAQSTSSGSTTQNFGTSTLGGSSLSGSSLSGSSLVGSAITAASPAGASVAAVLGDAGRYLMARITALAQTNTAKIDASPKVVTLNNIEAVMEDKTQFFVPVAGYTSGDLYSISTGISLRVLPMVVEEDGQMRIKLDVAIEDGELTSQTVSNLPVIENSTIDTQAFINEGQALLIAGYRTNDTSAGVIGVPGLSKIPVIGALFRTNTNQKSHMERLFLLSPRVISP
jgi:type III secretion protein C